MPLEERGESIADGWVRGVAPAAGEERLVLPHDEPPHSARAVWRSRSIQSRSFVPGAGPGTLRPARCASRTSNE